MAKIKESRKITTEIKNKKKRKKKDKIAIKESILDKLAVTILLGELITIFYPSFRKL